MAADQAQYAIDIAAKMTAGEVTIDQLDQLTEKLTASGKNAVDFTSAMKRVSDQLTSAASTSKSANAALSEGESKYNELEKAADMAAKAAERAALKVKSVVADGLPEKLNAANAALAAAKTRYNELRQASEAAAFAVESAGGAASDQMRAAADAASLALAGQASILKTLSAAAKSAAGDIKNLAAANELADKAAAVKASLEGEAKALDKLTAEAAAANDNLKRLEGTQKNLEKVQKVVTGRFEKQASALSKTAGALGDLGGPLGSLGQKFIMPIKGATELASQLGPTRALAVAAGVGVGLLAVAVVAASAAFIAGVAAITKWGIGLAEANRVADEFSFDKQSKKFSANIKKTFGGLNIEPFLKSLSRMVDLFDASTGSGQTLKFLFEALFQPIVDILPKVMLWLEAFFIGMQIGALTAYIALKPLIKTVKEFLGFDDETSGETFKKIAKAGEYVAYVVIGMVAAFSAMAAVVAVVIGVVLVGAAAMFALLAAQAVAVGYAIYGLYKAFMIAGDAITDAIVWIKDAIVNGFNTAVDWLKSLSLVQIGVDLMRGLAKGITDGVASVVSAVTGGVTKAINTAKELLGIASPSKVFAEIGGFTAEGFTEGVEGGSKDAQSAMADMSNPSNAMRSADLSAQTEPTSGAQSGSGNSIDLSGATFVFQGVKDGAAAEPALRRMFLQLLNGTLEQTGDSFA